MRDCPASSDECVFPLYLRSGRQAPITPGINFNDGLFSIVLPTLSYLSREAVVRKRLTAALRRQWVNNRSRDKAEVA